MKALTISQPYASLIASGEKWIENRSWNTTYRGSIAIHAGMGTQYMSKADLVNYPTGCIIALAKLIGSVHIGSLKLPNAKPVGRFSIKQMLEHKHAEGPYCWILDEIQSIEPIIATGKQNLWYPSTTVLSKINEALGIK